MLAERRWLNLCGPRGAAKGVPHPFVRPGPSFRPDLRIASAVARSVLDGREHEGMLDRVGPRVRPLNSASEATSSKNVLLLISVEQKVSRVCGRSCLRFASDRQTDSALPHAEDELARHLAAPFF